MKFLILCCTVRSCISARVFCGGGHHQVLMTLQYALDVDGQEAKDFGQVLDFMLVDGVKSD